MNELKFIEVLKVKDGMFIDIQPHIERIFWTTIHFFDNPLKMDLTDDIIPVNMSTGLVKCRIVYGSEVISIDFEPYKMITIQSLAIIENNTIDYAYKYHNRAAINELVAKRGGCDDILIIKNSLITDTSFTNVVFKDFDGTLYTPSSNLLAGTKRRKLLDAGIIYERDIHVKDIQSYEGIYLINAMIDIEDRVFVDINAIK